MGVSTGTSAAAVVAPSNTTSAPTVAAAASTSTVSTSSVGPPVVVVRQLQAVRPYNGSSSWKLFRDHFNRVAKVNGWTTNDELVQHLTLSLEGQAAEVLRDFDDTAATALTDLWARLRHRFGEVDGERDAMRKFESRRQSDSESLVEFEQSLRSLYREAWPNASSDQRDAALKRRFEDGVCTTELSQYLRLHHRNSSFAETVEKARIYHATMDSSRPKKAVRFVSDASSNHDVSINHVAAPAQDLTPLISHLKAIEGRLDKMSKDRGPSTTKTSTSTASSQPPSTTSSQQSWRPRGSSPNQPPPANNRFGRSSPRVDQRFDQRFDQRPPSSTAPTSSTSTPPPPPPPPATDQFRGPPSTGPPGQRV